MTATVIVNMPLCRVSWEVNVNSIQHVSTSSGSLGIQVGYVDEYLGNLSHSSQMVSLPGNDPLA